MRKKSYFLAFAAIIALTLCGCSEKTQTDYIVCESTYALCTTAKCTQIEGQNDTVFCDCEVKTGYSIGSTPCHEPVESAEGKQVLSRYYPIKSYAACTNDRPWAWCFDKPCIVDKDDPSKAACACGLAKDKGPYVIVAESSDASTCTTGLYSSARVTDLDQATEFLKTSSELKPFDIKVLTAPK